MRIHLNEIGEKERCSRAIMRPTAKLQHYRSFQLPRLSYSVRRSDSGPTVKTCSMWGVAVVKQVQERHRAGTTAPLPMPMKSDNLHEVYIYGQPSGMKYKGCAIERSPSSDDVENSGATFSSCASRGPTARAARRARVRAD